MLSCFLASVISLLVPVNNQVCTPESKHNSEIGIGTEYVFAVIYSDPKHIDAFKSTNKLQVVEDESSDIQTFVINK